MILWRMPLRDCDKGVFEREKCGRREKKSMTEELLKLEKELSFDHLSHEDLHDIGESILRRVKEEKLGSVGIRAVVNGLRIYQYLMDGREEDRWLSRKEKTVETFGHSGYYLWAMYQEKKKYDRYVGDEEYAICGGSFPILIGGMRVGVFCVSGLAHDQDHQLIVDAFREFQGKSRLLSKEG